MSGRTKRVLVFTASLLVAPMPAMPFERGTREHALALLVCGLILTASSFYVVRGEPRLRLTSFPVNRLLITALIMLLFGMSLVVGSVVYLSWN
jgi:hypothetical protein